MTIAQGPADALQGAVIQLAKRAPRGQEDPTRAHALDLLHDRLLGGATEHHLLLSLHEECARRHLRVIGGHGQPFETAITPRCASPAI